MTAEEAEALNQAMVREFDGDPAATDSDARIAPSRLPNKKYHQILCAGPRPINADLTPYSSSKSTHRMHRDISTKNPPANINPEHTLSQLPSSDWAYAKRALARGDDPKKSSSASLTIARHDKPIRTTTPDTLSPGTKLSYLQQASCTTW